MSFTEQTASGKLKQPDLEAAGFGTLVAQPVSPARMVVPSQGLVIHNMDDDTHTFYIRVRPSSDSANVIPIGVVVLRTGELYMHPGRIVLSGGQALYVYTGDEYVERPSYSVTYAEITDEE